MDFSQLLLTISTGLLAFCSSTHFTGIYKASLAYHRKINKCSEKQKVLDISWNSKIIVYSMSYAKKVLFFCNYLIISVIPTVCNPGIPKKNFSVSESGLGALFIENITMRRIFSNLVQTSVTF